MRNSPYAKFSNYGELGAGLKKQMFESVHTCVDIVAIMLSSFFPLQITRVIRNARIRLSFARHKKPQELIISHDGERPGADLGPVDRLLAIKSAVESSNVVPPAHFRAAKLSDLLGRTPEDKVQVDMWLTYLRSTSLNAETLGSLNRVLSGRSFLVGQALSVADVDLYTHLLAHLDLLSVESTVHVCRWFEHVQHVLGVPEKKLFWVRAAAPFLIPLPELDKPQAQTEQAPAEPTAQPAVSAAAPAAQPEAKAAAEAPAATATKKDKKAAKPEEEGKKEAAKPSAKAEEAADLSPGLLDIRVGRVVRCWAHEGSEKLLCEEIDLGEASGTRNIASGIRLFYAPEQVQGRLVLVL
eukprot:gene35120-42536_t